MVVACANVASVIVAQSLARRHELAVHAALGATRADRIRRIVIESRHGVRAPQASSGCWSPAWGMAGLRWLGSSAFGFADIQMNGRVLAAGLLIAGATPIGFGLLPALRMAPADPQELRDGARAAGTTRRGHRLRNLIVGVQAAAADDPDGSDRVVPADRVETQRRRPGLRDGASADVPRRASPLTLRAARKVRQVCCRSSDASCVRFRASSPRASSTGCRSPTMSRWRGSRWRERPSSRSRSVLSSRARRSPAIFSLHCASRSGKAVRSRAPR